MKIVPLALSSFKTIADVRTSRALYNKEKNPFRPNTQDYIRLLSGQLS